ncbi:MAG: methyl-accepting chemotaxis protein [bacterium]
MKLSNKLIAGALGIVLFVLICSTSITLFVIYRQNLNQAEHLLNQSIRIMRDDMSLTGRNLLVSSHQISISGEMGSKVNFMRQQGAEGAEFNVIMNTAREMVKSIYNNAITGNLWKVAIYDKNGDLTAFVRKEQDFSHFGFAYAKTGITAGSLKTGEELSLINDDYWKNQGKISDFAMKMSHIKPDKTRVLFERAGKYLTMVVHYPINLEVFDFDSGKDKIEQTGSVMTVYRFDDSFVRRLSDLAGTEFNIFNGDGLSVGVTSGFDTISLEGFKPITGEWDIQSQAVTLNMLDLNEVSYIQALLPVYQNSEVIGVFSSIYSTATAQANTWELFRIMCLILLGCVVVIIPVTFLFSRSMTQPLVNLFTTLSDIEETGEFVKRVEIKSRDEIGKTGAAFNGLMDSLQFAINDLNRVLESVANSDLSERITDDLKGDLEKLKIQTNQSIDMLGKTIQQVMFTGSQVKTGAKELASSAQALADGTTQQAASLEEISSSMNEIEAKTKNNNENASQAQASASHALETVEKGNGQMQEMLVSMNEINMTSASISKIIKVIDEIAFQTNLLALNAAVEAARAGKYGKGFAVVAEEVRNLASRSAEAAKNTTELIEKSTREIGKGVDNANKTADVLNEINESVKSVNDMVGEIAIASNEQTHGIAEINKGLIQVNDIVQRNSSISEETASASDELFSFAMQLESLIERFKLLEEEGSVISQYEELPLDENGENRRLLT